MFLWSVRHRVQKAGKFRVLKKFGYTQYNALLFGPFPWCKICTYTYRETCVYCSFCFLKFASVNFFCIGELGFLYPLNSLNRVRICAGTPYSAPRDLQKQDSVIARFSRHSKKKNLGIVQNFAKSCQHMVFW